MYFFFILSPEGKTFTAAHMNAYLWLIIRVRYVMISMSCTHPVSWMCINRSTKCCQYVDRFITGRCFFSHSQCVYLWKEHLSSLLSQPVPELIGHQVDTKLQFIKNKWRRLYSISVRVLFISVIVFSLSCVHRMYRILISVNLSPWVDLICSALSGSGCWCILAALAQPLALLDRVTSSLLLLGDCNDHIKCCPECKQRMQRWLDEIPQLSKPDLALLTHGDLRYVFYRDKLTGPLFVRYI